MFDFFDTFAPYITCSCGKKIYFKGDYIPSVFYCCNCGRKHTFEKCTNGYTFHNYTYIDNKSND